MDLKKIEKEVTQAVIFIDNDDNFAPLTLLQSKVLLNLVNRPILEYTMDMLTSSNIQEVFIFCCEHFKKIKNFIDDYKQKRNDTMNIQIFFSEDYTSLGAVVRDLDCKGVIKNNFILIHGDCIGNLRLDQLIEKHKQNIKKDNGCVMTCVFRKMSPNHRSRYGTNENAIVLLDAQQKIVFFEKNSKRLINIPTQLFEENPISIHYDLYDTQIAICSEKVPPDFTDNFDYETRENFINGLLADSELLRHHIYVHILEDGYAARVNNVLAYGYISCDILQRFVFPIVPDIEDGYSYRRNNVYLKDNVHFSKFKIMKNVTIGKNTLIGSETTIIDSVIGDDCKIGDNVSIINSYIFNNVEIQANSIIEKCIIDSHVNIGQNCVLEQNLISKNIIIDNNVHIENMKKLYYDSTIGSNKKIVGENGRGSEYICDQEQDDEDDQDEYNQCDSDSTRFSESSEDSCDSLGDEFSSFFNEIYDSLSQGIEEKSLAENIILEINSSKHAYNVPVKEVNSLVIKALLLLTLNEKGNFFTIFKSNLNYALPIVRNYIKNINSQSDCIYSIEEFYLNHKDRVSCLQLVKIIEYLYRNNILEEILILNWFYKPKILPDHETKEQDTLRQAKEINLFINWLQNADEESSDEEN